MPLETFIYPIVPYVLYSNNHTFTKMKYIDVYPDCNGCPVIKYCGTMIGSIRLCNSYDLNYDTEKIPTL